MSQKHDLSDSFRKQLDQEYTWPADYLFKFIVPVEQESELLKIFEGFPVATKYSRNKNYISVTSKLLINSSEEIVKIYKDAYIIKGIISL